MNGLNKVMLLGGLCADPELRFTQGGQAVLNLRIATTESYMDKDRVRQERTDYHNAVVWGPRGEALAKILTKGKPVFVEGSLRTSSYEKDGQKRYKTEIHVTNLILTGDRGHAADAGDAPASDAAPRGGGGSASGGQRQPASKDGGQAAAIAPDADLDGRFGNPKVKFSPRDWQGDDMKGRSFSECPAEFLDVLAVALQASADKPGKEPKYADYDRKDAARARGWARRIRAGKPGGAAPATGGGGDYSGTDYGAGDDDIPF